MHSDECVVAESTRWAVVTGACGGGVGEAIAYRLAKDGFCIVVHGRKAEAVEKVVSSIQAVGGTSIGVTADLSSREDIERFVKSIGALRGSIEIFVHNAADGAENRPPESITWAEWRLEFMVIIDSAFLILKELLPLMRKSNSGRVVFISSSAAERGTFGRAASYASAKSSLIGFAKQLAIEVGPDNITVNVLSPSQIDTPRVRKGGRRDDKSLLERGGGIPMRRVGSPDDVANLTSFICSSESGYLTGLNIPVDGGARLASAVTKTNFI